MPKFLIDVNLPYHFSLWNSENYIHQIDINDFSIDEQIFLRVCNSKNFTSLFFSKNQKLNFLFSLKNQHFANLFQ